MTYANVQAAHDALVTSLRAAATTLPDDIRYVVVDDLAELTDPPAVALMPPALGWGGPIELGPRDATWTIALVAPGATDASPRWFERVPGGAPAVDATADAVVRRAEAGGYQAGTTPLPAYFITAEVAL